MDQLVISKRVAAYQLKDLYALEQQAVDLLATIRTEIATRTPNLAAHVCGYDEAGQRLPAQESHRFARIQRSGEPCTLRP